MMDIKKDTRQAKYAAEIAAAASDNATSEIKAMKATICELQTKDDKFEKDIAEIKQQLTTTKAARNNITNEQETPDNLRELQVIVKGLKDELDEDEISKQLTKVVDHVKSQQKVDKIFTFTDPSRYGVLQFKTIASKFGFLKKVNQLEIKWESGEDMQFNNNETTQQRTLDKELGILKHYLFTTGGVPQEQVKILWKQHQVKSQGKIVAWITDSKQVDYIEEMSEVAAAVKKLVDAWKEKRNIQ